MVTLAMASTAGAAGSVPSTVTLLVAVALLPARSVQAYDTVNESSADVSKSAASDDVPLTVLCGGSVHVDPGSRSAYVPGAGMI